MKEQTIKPKKGIFRLLEIAGKEKGYLMASGIFSVIHACLALVPYILVYYIIQQLLEAPINIPQIQSYILWAVLAGVGSYAFLYFSGILAHISAFNILFELRRQTAEKLGQVSLGFVQGYSSGTLKKIISDDIERIEGFLAHQIPDFVKGLILPIITITYLFYVDWRLAAVSFVPLLIVAVWIPFVFSSPKTKEQMKKHHGSQELMSSTIVEFVKAMPVMKIFAQTAENFNKYSHAVNGFYTFSIQWLKQSAPPFAVFMSFMNNASLPILALGTYLYLVDGLSVSTLILFMILGVGYVKPIFALANMGMQIVLINKGVERMDSILLAPKQISQDDKQPATHSISFQRVSFAYEKGVNVLEDVSFHLASGSMTAFVGPSGAGKSTAAQLIARFWDIDSGSISIGDINVKDLRVETLMENVSYVFQDSFMFQETLYDNILMGMNKSEEEVIQAAKAARCHNFISQLPKGYETLFGETGVYLSGGEQQRIQLARAILKNAPILILDEATAFSDPENEYLIQQAVSHLIEGKTVVIIAHRLSTITDADQIILFDQGKVGGIGKHKDLLQQSDLYQQMWRAHVGAQEFSI